MSNANAVRQRRAMTMLIAVVGMPKTKSIKSVVRISATMLSTPAKAYAFHKAYFSPSWKSASVKA